MTTKCWKGGRRKIAANKGHARWPTDCGKGLTSYGDAGFSLFLRKAFIKAMGYSDDALNRPIVGITNTHSDYNPCHGNVPQIIEAVKRGVMPGGRDADGVSDHLDRRKLCVSDLDVFCAI